MGSPVTSAGGQRRLDQRVEQVESASGGAILALRLTGEGGAVRMGHGGSTAHGEGGVAAVEFAILLPLLVVLLFGFIQFGIAFNTKIQATNGAREGARMVVVGIDSWDDVSGSGKGYWQLVQERAGVGSISNCSVQVPAVIGGTVTVAFDYPIDLTIPFLPTPASWQGGRATASMRMEQFSQQAYPWGAGVCGGP
jgi:TadE-like protein